MATGSVPAGLARPRGRPGGVLRWFHVRAVKGIVPDNVSGFGETASYKEPFDDVDFLIHGLRGGTEKLGFRRRKG